MSACFYDMRWYARMLGLDKHMFFERPDLLVGQPKKDTLYITQCMNVWPLHNDKHTTTVTSDGNEMIQKGFAFVTLPMHMPVTVVNASFLGAATANILWWLSKTEPKLVVSSVTGQAQPLATCVSLSDGINTDCGGIAWVYNPNTVRTTPSAGDYLAANIAVGVSALLGEAFGRTLPDGMGDVPKWVIEKVFEQVQNEFIDPMVDEAIEESRDAIDGCL